MTRQKTISFMLTAATVIGSLAAPALAQERWDWAGGRPGDREIVLEGRGVPNLLPQLRDSRRGRAFVMRNFDENANGRISPREADDANRAFLRIAGERDRRFDWEARDADYRGDHADRADRGERRGDWDRRGMREYHMRQTREGATLVLQDVLFRTASAQLRPGAAERLRPLAGYLRANPDVRIRIDGHTDSQGSDVANQQLSEHRTDSVAAALENMGVERARFRMIGHGEASPVATNASAAGRQLNRRVEVTLIGQQARSFG